MHATLATRFLRREQTCSGASCVQEIHSKQKSGAAEDSPRRGPESLPVGHHDIITDVATFQTTQGFIVTSSRDGIVKVWK